MAFDWQMQFGVWKSTKLAWNAIEAYLVYTTGVNIELKATNLLAKMQTIKCVSIQEFDCTNRHFQSSCLLNQAFLYCS